jgi:hypothetical protein
LANKKIISEKSMKGMPGKVRVHSAYLFWSTKNRV